MGIAAAIAGVGSAVIGGVTSVISGNKAANAAKDAAQQSADVQKYIYDQTRSDYAPWRQVGQNSLYKLAGWAGVGTGTGTGTGTGATPANDTTATPDYSSFYTSPGYQFRLSEGMKAIQRSAAARGGLNSGATMKALNDYAQGQASEEYGNEWNRLAGLAGVGQAATGSTAAAGQNYATGLSNAYTNAGNARASAYQNTGNSINQGVQNLASAYLYSSGYGKGGGGSGYNYFTGGEWT